MLGLGLAGLPQRGRRGGHLVWEVLADRWLSGRRTDQASTKLRLAGCWDCEATETSRAKADGGGGELAAGTGSLSCCCLRVALSEIPGARPVSQKSQRPRAEGQGKGSTAGCGGGGGRGLRRGPLPANSCIKSQLGRPLMTTPVASFRRCLWLGVNQRDSWG